MNERIKELAIKAGGIWQGGYVEQANGDSVYTDKKFVNGSDMDVEQFARLLVKEAGKYLTSPEFIGRSDLDWSMVLNEHFGVEE